MPEPFDLTTALQARREQALYRQRRTLASAQGPVVEVDGERLLNFCSNDYLGLANTEALKQAMAQAAAEFGTGSGASHLVVGHQSPHHQLEQELAAFCGRPRALLFSSGYLANLGVISALVGKGDSVLQDRLNHASLLDAGLLSGARLQRYRHNDAVGMTQKLERIRQGRCLVATDGVFSMDGDRAPLAELASATVEHNAWLMVDDAHGFGVVGPQGAGSVTEAGLDVEHVPIVMGTLGKAFGTMGAFVAGSEELIEYLIQAARTYIYTTALPPAVAQATRASLRLVREGDDRRAHLQALIGHFRERVVDLGYQLMASTTPIQPILVGDNDQAMALSEALRRRGILIGAIRPPTVPPGTARLRVTLSAAHSFEQVNELIDALRELREQTF